MNITPERALEFAKLLEANEVVFNDGQYDYYLTDLFPEAFDVAAILRHYAEIAPKWQAVLNAEPVARVVKWNAVTDKANRWFSGINVVDNALDHIHGGTDLIIKPKE